MAHVNRVAEYILFRLGTLPAMKLQKLAYYSQAWHLVWEDKPLFPDRIEAWANGPVVRNLYTSHRLMFEVAPGYLQQYGPELTSDEQETIDQVLDAYGSKSSQWLSELTHMEDPWRNAREDLAPGDRGESEITHAAMAEYYAAL